MVSLNQTQKEAVSRAFAQIPAEAKDVFYYIVAVRDGKANFRDLIGHTTTVNQVQLCLDFRMTQVGSNGFMIEADYNDAFKELFQAEIRENKYKAPKLSW